VIEETEGVERLGKTGTLRTGVPLLLLRGRNARDAQLRIKRANLVGPSGYVSMEDTEATELVQRGTVRDEDLDDRDVACRIRRTGDASG
jgi:hypothetical protein